jgi:hypothetical protein
MRFNDGISDVWVEEEELEDRDDLAQPQRPAVVAVQDGHHPGTPGKINQSWSNETHEV